MMQRTRHGSSAKRWRAMIGGAALVAAATTGSAAVVEREGVRFDDTIRLSGSTIVLNGVGVRAAAWFKGYVAGLWLPEKATDAETVYAMPGVKRIGVRMLVDAGPDLLAKTFADGIRKNYKGEALAPLQSRMDAFDAQVRGIAGGVKKGQEIDLDFHPASGTRVLVAGKPIGDAIAGEDFYVALLKMFIGERAIDKGLRASLLGGGAN